MRATYISVRVFSSLGGLRGLLKVEGPWIILSSVVIEDGRHENSVERVANPVVELLGRERVRRVHH